MKTFNIITLACGLSVFSILISKAYAGDDNKDIDLLRKQHENRQKLENQSNNGHSEIHANTLLHPGTSNPVSQNPTRVGSSATNNNTHIENTIPNRGALSGIPHISNTNPNGVIHPEHETQTNNTNTAPNNVIRKNNSAPTNMSGIVPNNKVQVDNGNIGIHENHMPNQTFRNRENHDEDRDYQHHDRDAHPHYYREMPHGYRTIIAAGITYFVLDDIWYTLHSDIYEEVPPPSNVTIIESLPEVGGTLTIIDINGIRYYFSDGRYYRWDISGQYLEVTPPVQ